MCRCLDTHIALHAQALAGPVAPGAGGQVSSCTKPPAGPKVAPARRQVHPPFYQQGASGSCARAVPTACRLPQTSTTPLSPGCARSSIRALSTPAVREAWISSRVRMPPTLRLPPRMAAACQAAASWPGPAARAELPAMRTVVKTTTAGWMARSSAQNSLQRQQAGTKSQVLCEHDCRVHAFVEGRLSYHPAVRRSGTGLTAPRGVPKTADTNCWRQTLQ